MSIKTKDLFSLGHLWISDFVDKDGKTRSIKHELKLVMEEDTKAVRLETVAPPNTMFGKYWYRSGVNEQMIRELKDIAESTTTLIPWKKADVFLDIACNDGTLLKYVNDDMLTVGIDPSDDDIKNLAENNADLIIQDFFSAEIYKKSIYKNKNPKIITSIAVFYHIDKPDNFCKDIYEIMDDEGLWVIQMSYAGLMLKQLAFDNILSEHIYYYSLYSLKSILERNGFIIVDCQLNDTNGGSFRVYVRKKIANPELFATQPYRDVCNIRIQSILAYEEDNKINDPNTWILFYNNIKNLREKLLTFIKQEKAKGKSIWGYAASTKGNTLLQWFGLDNTILDGIAERSPEKWGLRTIGTNVPIYSEDVFRKVKPDYTILLAWHFIKSFKEREKDYLTNGGKFIIPMPTFKILG